MALRIRRGTDAERLTVTPQSGEPIYTTDTKLLYVGDGTTVGGKLISGTVSDDTSPQLGGNLDLNGNNITGTGNININGTITATGNINLGDSDDDEIDFAAQVNSDIVPSIDSTHNLGTSSNRWSNLFASGAQVDGQINAVAINASLVADDSTVNYDKSTGVFSGNLNGDVTGDLTGDVTGDITNSSGTSTFSGTVELNGATVQNAAFDLTGNLTGDVDGDVTGTLFGTHNGDHFGSTVGDLIGDVRATDSTLLIDGSNGDIFGSTLQCTTASPGEIDMTGAIKTTDIVAVQNATRSYMYLTRKDTSQSLSGATSPVGTLAFSYEDNAAVIPPVATISAGTTRMIFGVDSDGISGSTPNANYFVWRDNKFGIGTRAPSQTLDVKGDALIVGTMTSTDAAIGSITISENNITTTDSNANVRIAPAGTGTLELDVPTQTTVGGAGAASAPPTNPTAYIKINVGGTDYVIPAYAVS